MKALVYHGVGDLRVEDVPKPVAGEGEIIVKVHSCSICGTDVRTYKSGHSRLAGSTRIIGHEFSGTVEQVGPGVEGFVPGEKVTVVPGISCGKCVFCRQGLENLCVNRKIIGFDYDGAFAEYVRIPAEAVSFGNVLKISGSLDLTSACLVEPFTAVYNGQNLLSIGPGDCVAVIGAGPIGIMHMLQARARGAATVGLIEVSEARLQEAVKFTPDFLINSMVEDVQTRVKNLTDGLGFDVVIVACAVASAQRQALELARPGGRVSFFAGLPHDKPDSLLNANLIHYKQLAVFGANGSGPNQYKKTLRFLESGRVDLRPVVTTELPLEEALLGFQKVMQGEGLKVVVHPHGLQGGEL